MGSTERQLLRKQITLKLSHIANEEAQENDFLNSCQLITERQKTYSIISSRLRQKENSIARRKKFPFLIESNSIPHVNCARIDRLIRSTNEIINNSKEIDKIIRAHSYRKATPYYVNPKLTIERGKFMNYSQHIGGLLNTPRYIEYLKTLPERASSKRSQRSINGKTKSDISINSLNSWKYSKKSEKSPKNPYTCKEMNIINCASNDPFTPLNQESSNTSSLENLNNNKSPSLSNKNIIYPTFSKSLDGSQRINPSSLGILRDKKNETSSSETSDTETSSSTTNTSRDSKQYLSSKSNNFSDNEFQIPTFLTSDIDTPEMDDNAEIKISLSRSENLSGDEKLINQNGSNQSEKISLLNLGNEVEDCYLIENDFHDDTDSSFKFKDTYEADIEDNVNVNCEPEKPFDVNQNIKPLTSEKNALIAEENIQKRNSVDALFQEFEQNNDIKKNQSNDLVDSKKIPINNNDDDNNINNNNINNNNNNNNNNNDNNNNNNNNNNQNNNYDEILLNASDDNRNFEMENETKLSNDDGNDFKVQNTNLCSDSNLLQDHNENTTLFPSKPSETDVNYLIMNLERYFQNRILNQNDWDIIKRYVDSVHQFRHTRTSYLNDYRSFIDKQSSENVTTFTDILNKNGIEIITDEEVIEIRNLIDKYEKGLKSEYINTQSYPETERKENIIESDKVNKITDIQSNNGINSGVTREISGDDVESENQIKNSITVDNLQIEAEEDFSESFQALFRSSISGITKDDMKQLKTMIKQYQETILKNENTKESFQESEEYDESWEIDSNERDGNSNSVRIKTEKPVEKFENSEDFITSSDNDDFENIYQQKNHQSGRLRNQEDQFSNLDIIEEDDKMTNYPNEHNRKLLNEFFHENNSVNSIESSTESSDKMFAFRNLFRSSIGNIKKSDLLAIMNLVENHEKTLPTIDS